MNRQHVFRTDRPAQETPNKALPDGLIAGNGDLTVTLAGTSDRVKLYIGKADFWKADGRVYVEERGGIAPLGLAELLLPHLAYAEYRAEQNLDEASISLHLTEGPLSADVKITVCAGENTILVELNHSYPAVSASLSLRPLHGTGAIVESGEERDVSYMMRGFDEPELRFPTFGICALRRIFRRVSEDGRRERIVWAIAAATNHDTAAYRSQTVERVGAMTAEDCERLLSDHAAWWRDFWSKSGVSLPGNEDLELYWYAGIYACACCMGNREFPPGLWGAYSTADGMGWFGDYHLNYNYQAPFYALTASNHPELLDCYMAPLNEFLPIAKRYADEFLGVRGAVFPVGIGPHGMETDVRPDTKEHGHLFLGQKSNGAYACVIPMLHWYATRDREFAKREYYDFLRSVAIFWEDYLVFEDGRYHIYNDSLNEVGWYAGPDHMPVGHDDKNPIVSRGLVRMLMKLMIDLAGELGVDEDRIPKWRHILEHLPLGETFERNGEQILRGIDGSTELRELAMECMFPAGQIGRYSTPELFEAAKNTHRQLSIWDSHNRFCSYYPEAVRLGLPPEEIIGHIREVIEKRGLPNGMFRYGGGGLENSAAVPGTLNEMLLQSYEDIIRLFPCWDPAQDASFHGLRAFGAFVIDAEMKDGTICAQIRSEKGRLLKLEKPGEGYIVVKNGETIPLTELFTEIETEPGEFLLVRPVCG
ncbi:MAG: hypothetical protein E7576_12970 [Ruminococcaceae bacterium]|jgi:hypothetical protein|nr:hypothetical protein [Oscillospiraceae bacterium]